MSDAPFGATAFGAAPVTPPAAPAVDRTRPGRMALPVISAATARRALARVTTGARVSVFHRAPRGAASLTRLRR